MQLGNLEKAIGSLMQLAIYPLVLLVVMSVVGQLMNHLSLLELLGLLAALVLMSPVAYVIRQSSEGRRPRPDRRGAERTPLLPPNEDEE